MCTVKKMKNLVSSCLCFTGDLPHKPDSFAFPVILCQFLLQSLDRAYNRMMDYRITTALHCHSVRAEGICVIASIFSYLLLITQAFVQKEHCDLHYHTSEHYSRRSHWEITGGYLSKKSFLCGWRLCRSVRELMQSTKSTKGLSVFLLFCIVMDMTKTKQMS